MTAPRSSFSISEKTKRRLVVGAVATAIVVIVASTLGYLYYYQPVRGDGSVSITTIDAGQSVQFSFMPNQGVSPYRYSWNFGDGGVSAERSPLHSYNSPGTYAPTVAASDTAGKTVTWTTTIIVNPLPSVAGAVSPSVGVRLLTASFSVVAHGGTPGYTYHWNFGDGSSIDGQYPTHTYMTGKYSATVVVTDGAGMTAMWSAGISVVSNLTVGITYTWTIDGEIFACTPSQGVPPYSFYWEFGNGRSSTLQNPVYNYGAPGTYIVHLNVTDSIGEIVEIQRTLVL